MTDKSSGRVFYDAFWDEAGGKHPVTGEPLPLWDDLPVMAQTAIEAGAAQVEVRFAERFRTVFEALWSAAKPLVASAVRAFGDAARP